MATMKDEDNETGFSQGPVFIGETQIAMTHTTLKKIVNDWLHVNVSGGPYEVTSIAKDSNGYDNTGFTVKFRDVPPTPPEARP